MIRTIARPSTARCNLTVHIEFLFALESNRLVSVEKGTWVQVMV